MTDAIQQHLRAELEQAKHLAESIKSIAANNRNFHAVANTNKTAAQARLADALYHRAQETARTCQNNAALLSSIIDNRQQLISMLDRQKETDKSPFQIFASEARTSTASKAEPVEQSSIHSAGWLAIWRTRLKSRRAGGSRRPPTD